METQFELETPPQSPLISVAKLQVENRARWVNTHLDTIKKHLDTSKTMTWVPPLPPPTPPKSPPLPVPKSQTSFQMLGNVIEVNRTTTATQWAIDAQNKTTPETQELPSHYQQHWQVFSEKLMQCFPPS